MLLINRSFLMSGVINQNKANAEILDNSVFVLTKLLTRSGVDPKEAKASAKYYAYTPLIWAARDGRKRLVEVLVEKGARVEDRTSGGYTALHKACIEGHHEVCEVLLQSEAEVDCKDKHGNTPLHIACYQGHVDTVTMLLRWGAKLLINLQDMTPLDVAKEEEEAEVVRILEHWLLDHPQVGKPKPILNT